MKRLFAVALWLLTGLASPVLSSTECALIQSNTSRLACYDAAYRNEKVGSKDSNTSQAFEEFKKIAEYSGKDGWNRVFFEDCIVYQHELVWKENMSQAIIYQLYVDMKELDAGKTKFSAFGGVELVAKRGGNIYTSTQTMLEPFHMARAIKGGPFLRLKLKEPETSRLDRGAVEWRKYTLMQGTLDIFYPLEKFDHPNAYPKRSEFTYRDFQSKEQRSLDWNFAYFWPEDKREISAAFIKLAGFCSKP